MAAYLHLPNGYKCKVKKCCDSIDPLTLDVRLCVDPLPRNVGYFDIVNYCIEKGSTLYTWQSFKNYKIMDAFKWFESGFVTQLRCQFVKEGALVIACVRCYSSMSSINNV